MQRFALWQDGHNAWRVIDNGLTSGHNSTADTYEQIHTACTDMWLAILETFTRLTRDEPVDLVVGTQDMKSAYRQLPVSQDQQRFSIIAIWH
eukprot:416019-Karenia_brevis.AAC.1